MPIKKNQLKIPTRNNKLTQEQFPIIIDFNIDDDRFSKNLEVLATKAIITTLKQTDIKIIAPIELSILLTNDETQKTLNLKWLKKDKTTNVLSFAQISPFADLSGLIGDISLAYETLKKEAEQLNIEFEHHFIHLLVHGLLHIIGYIHDNEKQAKTMEGLEIKILASLGIKNPYILV